jgi:ABC-type glutathione transport system ATPase component
VEIPLAAAGPATDTEQAPGLTLGPGARVARVGHLSLLREGEEGPGPGLVEVASTREGLARVAGAVAAGRPVLLVGEAGAGKTGLVRELARRAGRQLLTLQVDNMQWCSLNNVYSMQLYREKSLLCTFRR